MEMIFINLNWVAVAVGFIVSFVLGALWYSPKMFGKGWARGVGHDLDKMQNDGKGPMKFNLIMQALTIVVYATVINIALLMGSYQFVLLIIAMVMLFIKTNGLWGTKSMYAIRVEVGFVFVMGIIMLVSQILI